MKEEPKTPLHVLIPVPLKKKLAQTSRRTGWTRAELTRKALTFYLENVQITWKEAKEMTRLTGERFLDEPEDHAERMEAARDRARWEIGDGSWAQVIIAAYFRPHESEKRLEREEGLK